MHPLPPFVQPRGGWRGRLETLLVGLGRHARPIALAVLAASALTWLVWARAAPRPDAGPVPLDTAAAPRAETEPETEPATAAGGGPADPGTGGRVAVHVAGRVRRGGLITLPAGSRVADAVEAAGGAAAGADLDRLNLAKRLTDGEQVLVPARGDPGPPAGAGAAPGAGTAPPVRSTSTPRRSRSSTPCPGSAPSRPSGSSPTAASTPSARSRSCSRCPASASAATPP
jgi:hypothetical protein